MWFAKQFKKISSIFKILVNNETIDIRTKDKKGDIGKFITTQGIAGKKEFCNELNTEQLKIKEISEKRNIQSLVHFTMLDNLESILKHGLLPVSVIERRNIKAVITDPTRYDNEKDAICLSISYPNYKYFYWLRKNRYPDKAWVVIELKPDILWEKDCAFCITNAANKNVSNTL